MQLQFLRQKITGKTRNLRFLLICSKRKIFTTAGRDGGDKYQLCINICIEEVLFNVTFASFSTLSNVELSKKMFTT